MQLKSETDSDGRSFCLLSDAAKSEGLVEDVQFVRWIRREDEGDSWCQSADAAEVEQILGNLGQYEDSISISLPSACTVLIS